MTGGAGAHMGGTLSCVEILTYLYFIYKINLNKKIGILEIEF